MTRKKNKLDAYLVNTIRKNKERVDVCSVNILIKSQAWWYALVIPTEMGGLLRLTGLPF